MMLRLFLSILLTCALAFTSLTMAQTRGAAAATGQMVICSGMGTTVVYVDAQGQPTQAPHICPDCMMMLAPEGATAPLTRARDVYPARYAPPLSHRDPAPLTGRLPPPRAPPLTV